MKTLDNVEVGDMVVIAPMHDHSPYRVVKVEKVTKTQLTAGNERFNRRNGVRIGDGDSWTHRMHLAFGDQWQVLMTPDEAEAKNAEIEAERERLKLIIALTGLRRSKLERVSTDNLKAALELLETS